VRAEVLVLWSRVQRDGPLGNERAFIDRRNRTDRPATRKNVGTPLMDNSRLTAQRLQIQVDGLPSRGLTARSLYQQQ
jgi:hypothetical protein